MKRGNGRKIVVGMSGGVDSSISLVLLKRNDWKPIGVSLKFGTWNDKCNAKRENSCCTDKSIKTAQKICEKYGCKHVILDVSKNFHEKVIKYFTQSLKNAETPNPCIICNRYLKFFELFEYAKKNKIDYIATGHYAKIVKSSKYGGYFISRPKDRKKDQTYYLAMLPQECLPYIIFPLSDIKKEEVYKMAEKENLDFFQKIAQSQDFCFVSEKSLYNFIEKEVGATAGVIKNTEGKVLGKHIGLAHYTIGQRKNIGLSGGPYFVIKKDLARNELTVSKRKKDLLKNKIPLNDVSLTNNFLNNEKINVKAKIRYQHKPAKATLDVLKNGMYLLTFENPQTSITPGQYAVFYSGNLVMGAGQIR